MAIYQLPKTPSPLTPTRPVQAQPTVTRAASVPPPTPPAAKVQSTARIFATSPQVSMIQSPQQVVVPAAQSQSLNTAPSTTVAPRLLAQDASSVQQATAGSLPSGVSETAPTPLTVASGLDAGGFVKGVAKILQGLVGVVGDAASTVQSFGPQNALQVVPVTFQSVEQEGRWKPDPLFVDSNGDPRRFVLKQQQTRSGDSPNAANSLAWPYGDLKGLTIPLFTMKTDDNQSSVSIGALYWCDGLEIWGGWAGMTAATGFQTVFGDMGYVSLAATPFGNYYPASVLITWTGWYNPAGPAYCEFRGAYTLVANPPPGAPKYPPTPLPTATGPLPTYGTSSTPSLMYAWDRDGNYLNITSDPKSGYVLNLQRIPVVQT